MPSRRRHRPAGPAAALGPAPALAVLLLAAGCDSATTERHPMPGARPEAGREVIVRVGCAACHVVPGVDWPRGRTGPSLEGFADRPLIAGKLPNQPDRLAAYVRDAPAYTPGSGMPPMPLTQQEARDVAAYLYTLRDR